MILSLFGSQYWNLKAPCRDIDQRQSSSNQRPGEVAKTFSLVYVSGDLIGELQIVGTKYNRTKYLHIA